MIWTPSHTDKPQTSQTTAAATVIIWYSGQDISLCSALTSALEPHFAGQTEENT